MPAARSFTELQFWQRAREWSKQIFHLTQQSPFSRDQRLVVQINDSSESAMANMAEGFGRGTQEEFITFLGYAIGSLDETQSHLCAAYDRAHIDKDQFAQLLARRHRHPQTHGGLHSLHDPPARRRPHARQTANLVQPSLGNLRTRHRPTAPIAVRVARN
ncbi:MAG: four helix bundle protein [Planctomycetes bacterium]|nr:four helix bundle protein [Planctomycetota bacterium]